MLPQFYLSHSNNVLPANLTRTELLVVELAFLIHIHASLKDWIRESYKEYFHTLNFTQEMEEEMIKANLISNLIKDILITQQYTIEGIAMYTNAPPEAIEDVLSGKNHQPSFELAQRIIDLHKMVRPKLYKEIINKIIGMN
jgi:hypothetical protein